MMACYFFNISYKVSFFAFPYMFTFVCFVCFKSGEKSWFLNLFSKYFFLLWCDCRNELMTSKCLGLLVHN